MQGLHVGKELNYELWVLEAELGHGTDLSCDRERVLGDRAWSMCLESLWVHFFDQVELFFIEHNLLWSSWLATLSSC